MTIYRNFGGMCWPAPGQVMSEIDWRLRHAPSSITEADMLQVASVLSAYRELVNLPQRLRNEYIKELRKGPNIPTAARSPTEQQPKDKP